MKLYIVSQDRESLVLMSGEIKIKRKKIVHGKIVLGKYKTQEQCKQVMFEISSCIDRYHQFTDDHDRVVMAFATTSEGYVMPTVEELENRMKGGE